jgi:hypothetical protein
VDLVRQHLLSNIARLLHDEVGPALSGLGLQLSVWQGEDEERRCVREALEHTVETVRTLQYLAHGGVAARFGLRRAFEILPYCAAPSCQERVSVTIAALPAMNPDEAQRCFEQAATAVAEATQREPGSPLEVRLNETGWALHRREAA